MVKDAIGGSGDRPIEDESSDVSVEGEKEKGEEQKTVPTLESIGDKGDGGIEEAKAELVEDMSTNALDDDLQDDLKTKIESESVLRLLDKERKDIELRLHSSKSTIRARKGLTDDLDEDLQMPRIPAVFYEPKDTSKMTDRELRRERILRQHLKEKFFPSPPEHVLEKMLRQKEGATAAAKKSKPRDRPWAQTPFERPFEDTIEGRRLRNAFNKDSTKCSQHKSPYLQPQARFHTRDPGNRPGVTEGTWMVARPQLNGTVAMETKHVGQPAIEGTVTYRFSDELLKARQGISKPPWSGLRSRELRPPTMALDLEPFENFSPTKVNYAHLPQVRERAAMVKRRYVDKVRSERSEINSDFRARFQDQMRSNATPQKTQQRLVEMLDRYVPPFKQQPQQVKPDGLLRRRRQNQLPPLLSTIHGGLKRRR